MMSSDHAKLVTEINAELDWLAEDEKPWIANWIAETICKRHADGLASKDTDDRRFWLYGARSHVRWQVANAIRNRAGDQTERGTPQQIELPGFEREHLQDYYTVKREGVEIGVPITQLTDIELRKKSARLRATSTTCLEHADEIDRYIEWRSANNRMGAK